MVKGRPRKSSAKGTKGLPASAFAYPKTRSYPINTRARARNALARAAQKGTRGSYSTVARKVKARYPGITLRGQRRKGTRKRTTRRRRR